MGRSLVHEPRGWRVVAGPGLLTGVAILSLVFLVSPFNIGSLVLAYVMVLGFGLIIKLLEMLLAHMKPVIDRLDPRHRRASTQASCKCPRCGYVLRGVKGIYCPECGTVRPARLVHEHESA